MLPPSSTTAARITLVSLLTLALWSGAHGRASSGLATQSPGQRWFKGNTHTHTLNSDGDSSPDEVVRWYREHGYHFLVLTDHNYLTSVDGLNALVGAEDQFLVIKGEEVTDVFEKKPLHINGLAVERTVQPGGGSSVSDILQRNVDAIRAASGVPHINHPNFGWAITEDDLARVQRYTLLEIFNGHPMVNNLGGGGIPGMEEVWDFLLSKSQTIYGLAVDDAHHFKRPWDPLASKPGRGWIYVRADRLNARAIVDAIDRGAFYASTGVELSDVTTSTTGITLRIVPSGFSRYRTQFVGRGGAVLAETTANPAEYRFTGSEGYVRARVLESNGATAWLQAVRVP
ncbi:MAG: CehA/McbA family metallohydrolase [Vicinamibacterales bacterium]